MTETDPGPAGSPTTIAATYCATLVDEWARAGVCHAVISPGSRSTPLALALVDQPQLVVHVHHDERSAAFTALGIALATGTPCIVLTTSGTAAAELHPAAVEADLARVPLVLCTADRPPELRGVGAPQTIEQTGLLAPSVRWFADPGVPDDASLAAARSLASRVVSEALGPPAGPVHLNLPFREPLVGRPDNLPEGRTERAPWHRRHAAPRTISDDDAHALAEICRGRRGLIVAGGAIEADGAIVAGETAASDPILALGRALGWPVLADPRSGCRVPDPVAIAHFDAIVRSGVVEQPDVVLRLGSPPASKELAAWVRDAAAVEVVVDADGWWLDPDRRASLVVAADPTLAARDLALLLDDHSPTNEWLDRWSTSEAAAAAAIAVTLDGLDSITEPAIARTVVETLPDDGALVAASSMPVRDVEWFATSRAGGNVYANRGANGIDGVVSTAVGVALSGRSTRALVGDIAFLHDTNGLLGAADRDIDLTVVVVDNDGGGIFSFLPQAQALSSDRFEQLFGTPHGLDVAAVATAHGATAARVADLDELRTALDKTTGRGGVDVIVATTDRDTNVAVHHALHAATRAAVERAWRQIP